MEANKITGTLKKYLFYSAYLLTFVLLLSKVIDLKIILDDNVHIFPALLKSYAGHFKSYIYGYGLLRPLALLFFYFIYSLYLLSPAVSHVLIFAVHFATGFILMKIIEPQMGKKAGILLSLVYIAFPFLTEQYAWFAASNAVIANFILFMQIYICLAEKPGFKRKLATVLILQSIGILFYENLFFTFIPLAIIISKNQKRIRHTVANLILLSIPSIVYFLLRNIFFPAHNPITVRELSFSQFINGNWVSTVTGNIAKFLSDGYYLFFSSGAMDYFWKTNIAGGFKLILSNGLLIILINYLLLSLLVLLFYGPGLEIKSKAKMNVWLAIGFFSLLPAFFLTQPSFPFRLIALPFFMLLTAFSVFIFNISRMLMYTVFFLVFVFCLIFSLNILKDMKIQSDNDEKISNQVVNILDKYVLPGYQTTLIVSNIPHSTVTEFTYGEYLSACFSVKWCLQANLNRKTDKVKDIVINPDLYQTTSDNYLLLEYNSTDNKLFLK